MEIHKSSHSIQPKMKISEIIVKNKEEEEDNVSKKE